MVARWCTQQLPMTKLHPTFESFLTWLHHPIFFVQFFGGWVTFPVSKGIPETKKNILVVTGNNYVGIIMNNKWHGCVSFSQGTNIHIPTWGVRNIIDSKSAKREQDMLVLSRVVFPSLPVFGSLAPPSPFDSCNHETLGRRSWHKAAAFFLKEDTPLFFPWGEGVGRYSICLYTCEWIS